MSNLIKGSKYRVVKEGAMLLGMVSMGNWSWTGERIPLQVGDIITYQGIVSGWGSDPYPEHRFSQTQVANTVRGLCYITFSPSTGLLYDPEDGYLELVG